MEIVVSFEIFRLQVFGNEFESCPEVGRKCPFRIRGGYEHHGPACRTVSLEQGRMDAVLFLVAFVKVTDLVIPHLPDKPGFHSENSGACYGVGSRPSGYVLYAYFLEGMPYLVAGTPVDMLHAAFGQMEVFKKCVIRKHGKDIRECIPHSQYGFHKNEFVSNSAKLEKIWINLQPGWKEGLAQC